MSQGLHWHLLRNQSLLPLSPKPETRSEPGLLRLQGGTLKGLRSNWGSDSGLRVAYEQDASSEEFATCGSGPKAQCFAWCSGFVMVYSFWS